MVIRVGCRREGEQFADFFLKKLKMTGACHVDFCSGNCYCYSCFPSSFAILNALFITILTGVPMTKILASNTNICFPGLLLGHMIILRQC